ncbi:MAG: LLM class flavin-dependent oxidoreductase, partial [Chitinophagaceae bacterium]|nr:LLM class flavin-dependent oxidoreductase [Chitinophagaceae bacterium]
AEQIRLYKDAWKKAGHTREPRISVSRSIFALINEQDRLLFGQQAKSTDQIGFIESDRRAIFGKSYAAPPDQLIKELAKDEAIQEADTLLLTIPNTLGVEYNVHVLSSILKHVAPGLGWR